MSRVANSLIMGPTVPPGVTLSSFNQTDAYSSYSSMYGYDYDDGYQPMKPENLFWSTLFTEVSIKGLIPFGVVTNAIFLLMVVRVPAMHTAVNIHLSNLAVADMIFLLFMAYKYKTNSSGFWMNIVNYVPYMASMLFVTTVAFGRCFAVFWPFRARAGTTRRRVVIIAVCIWLGSILFSVFFNLLTTNPDIDPLVSDILYLSINPTFLLINLILFTSIIIGFRQSQHLSTTSLSQRRLVIMLAVNTAVFFTFEIAATSFNLYAMFNQMDITTIRTSHSVIFMLLFLNSGINPLVYGSTNVDYRKAFVSAFCTFFKKGQEPRTQNSNYMEVNDRQTSTV